MILANALRILAMSLLSALLCAVTVFFAPLPLLLLRRNQGAKSMVAASLIGVLVLSVLAPASVVSCYLAAVVTTVLLSELENTGVGYTLSVFITVVALAGMGLLLVSVASKTNGFNPIEFFREQISLSLTQLKLPPEMAVDKEKLLLQVPSALLVLVILAVWANSVLARRMERLLGWMPQKMKQLFTSKELYQWRLPDWFVWPALVSAAGYFLEFEPLWVKAVSLNIFNVVVVLYFFQGLAVVVSFLEAKKASAFWRVLTYLLIFTQLFLGVAFLGFIDLWMEFRNKTKANKSPAL